MPIPMYVNVCRLIEMFSSFCNIPQTSVSACSVIIPQHYLLMQSPYFAIAYLCLYVYTKELFMGKSMVFQLSSIVLNFFLWES